MKLSFVIPAYNEAGAIGACLDSILRALDGKRADIEVIVVDNGSTDGTGAIAGSYPGVIVVAEPRKGITFARQAGFARSSGELIANLDADTLLTPGWLETVLREFSRDPRLVCLSGPFIYYDAPRSVRICARSFYGVAFLTYLVNRYLLRAGSLVQGGNFVCRRWALEQIGGFDTTIHFYGEDADVAHRLHRQGKVVFTFRLPIYASARRLAAEGLIATGARYALNYFWVLAFGRPFTRESTDIRPSQAQARGTSPAGRGIASVQRRSPRGDRPAWTPRSLPDPGQYISTEGAPCSGGLEALPKTAAKG
jgi:glycosyltransferase involved in cell wall biosynthesis